MVKQEQTQKGFETALDKVIPRYMSNPEASPCFNNGTIMPKQKSEGTNAYTNCIEQYTQVSEKMCTPVFDMFAV